MTAFLFRYDDDGSADSQGRRRFVMLWDEPHGAFRHEMGKDGTPVGYRRGQYFFTDPEAHIRALESRGHTVKVE